MNSPMPTSDCKKLQPLLWDYVYGLLSPSDTAEASLLSDLENHLPTCSACQSALSNVRGKKTRIAQAAKLPTNIQFKAPEVTPLRKENAPLATVAGRWVLAASLLLSVLLAAGTSLYRGQHAAKIDTELANLRTSSNQLAQVETKLSAIQAVSEEISKKEAATRQEIDDVRKARLRAEESKASFIVGVVPPTVHPVMGQKVAIELKNLGDPGMTRVIQPTINSAAKDDPLLVKLDANNLRFSQPSTGDVKKELPLSKPINLSPIQYQVYLSTDRPIYHPGDMIRCSAQVLDKATRQPVVATPQIRLLDPLGNPIFDTANPHQPGKPPLAPGLVALNLELKNQPVTGYYKLEASDDQHPPRFSTHSVTISVQDLAPSRYNWNLRQDKPSYGPGETVSITGEVLDALVGKPLSDSTLSAEIIVDGKNYDVQGIESEKRSSVKLNKDRLEFAPKLPQKIAQGDASIRFWLENQPNPKIIPIPVHLPQLLLHWFPEAGELVSSIPNRVYFQVTTPTGSPAELKAQLLEDDKVIAELATQPDPTTKGTGSIEFTPRLAASYRIQPIGNFRQIEVKSTMPVARSSHANFRYLKTSTDQLQSSFRVNNVGQARQLVLTEYARGLFLSMRMLTLLPTQSQEVTLETTALIPGIHRITLWEVSGEKLIPLAERLIYKEPVAELSVSSTAAQPILAGRNAQVDLRSTLGGKAMPTSLNVAVTEATYGNFLIDESQRSINSHFELAGELENGTPLENLDLYLKKSPEARKSLDLLLGTAGWRTFRSSAEQATVRNQFTTISRLEHSEVPQLVNNKVDVEKAVVQNVDSAMKQDHGDKLKQQEELLEKLKGYQQESKESTATMAKVKANLSTQYGNSDHALLKLDGSWNEYHRLFNWLSLAALGLALVGCVISLVGQALSIRVWLLCLVTLGLMAGFLFFGMSSFPRFSQEIRDARSLSREISQPQVGMAVGTASTESDSVTTGAAKLEAPSNRSSFEPKNKVADSDTNQARKGEATPNREDPDKKEVKDQFRKAPPSKAKGFGGGAGGEGKGSTGIPGDGFPKGDKKEPAAPAKLAPGASQPPPGQATDKPAATLPAPPRPGFGKPAEVPSSSRRAASPLNELEKKQADLKSMGTDASGGKAAYDSSKVFAKDAKDEEENAKKSFKSSEMEKLKEAAPGSGGMKDAEKGEAGYDRVYAFSNSSKSKSSSTDVVPTLYWNPLLLTKDGNATIRFDVPRDGGTYLLKCFGFDPNGNLTTHEATYLAKPVFTLKPTVSVPAYLHVKDELQIPMQVEETVATGKIKLEQTVQNLSVKNTPALLNNKGNLVINVPESAKGSATLSLKASNDAQDSASWNHSFELFSTRPAQNSTGKDLVAFDVRYQRGSIKAGEVLRATMVVRNKSTSKLGEVRGVLEVPAGLEIDPKTLELLKKKQDKTRIDSFYFEQNKLVLVWKELLGEENMEIPIDLSAVRVGKFHTSNSHASVTNQTNHKVYAESYQVTIEAK